VPVGIMGAGRNVALGYDLRLASCGEYDAREHDATRQQ